MPTLQAKRLLQARGRAHGDTSPHAGDQLITTRQLQQLLGSCSGMHIWRLCNDPNYAQLEFPRPIKMGLGRGRNYFRLSDVRRWIDKQMREAA
jgi:predicted DNA-binding transcriptional regulator AlpA